MNRHKMTLDEAIENAEEKAEEIRNESEHYEIAGVNIYGCEERAQEWEQFAEWLKELKRLREQTRWIPVSERMPEPRVDVWVNSDIGQIQGYYDEYVCTWYASFGQGRDYLELIVNAWMPLPAHFEQQESEG